MESLTLHKTAGFFVVTVLIGILAGCGGGGGAGGYSAGPSAPATTTSTFHTTTSTTTTTTLVTGTCFGTPTSAPAAIILPPSVPQPVVAGTDIVGVNLQNTRSANIGAHVFTFGQIFKSGQVQPTDTLVAHMTGIGTPAQVQLDTLATWPDGSVKLGAITLTTPIMCATSTLPVLLSKIAGSGTTPVDLANAPINLSVSMTFTSGQYTGTQTVDLGAALRTALAGSPDYWLRGPLATQARVDVPLSGGALHLTADVTYYADGSATADVQFNNDLTTILPQSGSNNPQAALPALQYDATVTFQGTPTNYSINQVQYSDWHVVLNSAGAPVLNVSSSSPPAINVQQDLAYLEHSGAILPYDRTTGVANQPTQYGNAFYSIATVTAVAGFGTPYAINGVTPSMPGTGGRADIGYTTMWNTVWLLTQDQRSALVGIAQSDTSGAVPWNYKMANGRWLTPNDASAIWTDGRGGPHGYTDGIANVADTSIWVPDTAHQPNLNYVPYIMTGARWNLDRLNAQAANGITSSWPGARCRPTCGTNTDDIVLNGSDQIRAEAWSMREIEEAAFIGKPGSFEQGYFTQVVTDNWNYIQSQEATLAAAGGQVYGYIGFGSYGSPTAIPEWMEDYLTGVAVLGAQMGSTGALQFINWQKDSWLTGRFIGTGMNPYDGCNYNLIAGNGTIPYTTWGAIENATVLAGDSNGAGNSNNWAQSNGDYCPLARAVLGGALTLYPGDANLTQALTWLNGANAPYSDQSSFQNDPTFNVVPLQ
ncbi:MAG TPA: hypothetical protein VIF82_02155 [Burkholderiaceae bacterium]|jgi:hypothetical protein